MVRQHRFRNGKPHATGLDDLDALGRTDLADILKRITTRYDNLFEVAFPYTMGFHQRPTDGQPHAKWHLASPQCDLMPEAAADRRRAVERNTTSKQRANKAKGDCFCLHPDLGSIV